MHDPAVLFLDEPTSGVDPITRREFWSHINAMVERGVTVMVTTHFLDEAEYCDRIALIYRGHVIALGSPDDLKERAARAQQPEPTLEDAFIALVEEFDRRGAAMKSMVPPVPGHSRPGRVPSMAEPSGGGRLRRLAGLDPQGVSADGVATRAAS